MTRAPSCSTSPHSPEVDALRKCQRELDEMPGLIKHMRHELAGGVGEDISLTTGLPGKSSVIGAQFGFSEHEPLWMQWEQRADCLRTLARFIEQEIIPEMRGDTNVPRP